MARRKRREFSDEFKQGAVRLCTEANRSIRDVARELDHPHPKRDINMS